MQVLAYPTENEILGTEMLSLLDYCLRYAIIAKPDHSVIQLKKLFENIRLEIIPDEDISLINEDLGKQPQERIDDFIQSLFGLYVDSKTKPEYKDKH